MKRASAIRAIERHCLIARIRRKSRERFDLAVARRNDSERCVYPRQRA